ncbi:hypothetical protein BD770DRAFT_449455 [Pilaira anomala]|nr:hypothetical protein BD770DRAFT_449455 [Pilaira anomala]
MEAAHLNPDGSLNSHNLLLRLRNPPNWIRENPGSIHLINELNRRGFFQEEVRRTQMRADQAVVMEKWRSFEYPLVIGLLCGIIYFYHYYCQDIERYYYISNKL